MIKEILDKKREEHISSGKFNISAIGGCFRRKYLEIRGEYKEEVEERVNRIFELGNIIHRQIIRELIEKSTNNMSLVAAEINIPENKYFSGRIDAIISYLNNLYIVDIKSAGEYTIDEVKRGNCPENYTNQVLLYMHFTGIHRGLILFVEKNNCEIKEIEVTYDKDKAEKLVREITDFFIKYVEESVLPPKCNGGIFGCKCCGIKNDKNKKV